MKESSFFRLRLGLVLLGSIPFPLNQPTKHPPHKMNSELAPTLANLDRDALRAAFGKAKRARAKANRTAALVASLHLDGDKRADGQLTFTRDDVATAALAAIKAARAVAAARAAFLATIRA